MPIYQIGAQTLLLTQRATLMALIANNRMNAVGNDPIQSIDDLDLQTYLNRALSTLTTANHV